MSGFLRGMSDFSILEKDYEALISLKQWKRGKLLRAKIFKVWKKERDERKDKIQMKNPS